MSGSQPSARPQPRGIYITPVYPPPPHPHPHNPHTHTHTRVHTHTHTPWTGTWRWRTAQCYQYQSRSRGRRVSWSAAASRGPEKNSPLAALCAPKAASVRCCLPPTPAPPPAPRPRAGRVRAGRARLAGVARPWPQSAFAALQHRPLPAAAGWTKPRCG
jgi:hypothetical protein